MLLEIVMSEFEHCDICITEKGCRKRESCRVYEDAKHPFGFSVDEMDTEAFFNMREWLRDALEAKGAKFTGGGK